MHPAFAAIGANSFEIRDQPGFADLAGEIATLDESRELFAATQVESLGFRSQFAVILNTDGDTIDRQLCERLRPRIELHLFWSLALGLPRGDPRDSLSRGAAVL